MTAERTEAVVVGGGFAGVTAARELQAAGQSTVLLEARDRLGGRTWTSEFEGMLVELGGAWVHWHQPHVWAELTRYGIGIREDDWHHDAALLGSPPRRQPAEASFALLRELFVAYAGDSSALLPHPHDPLRHAAELAELDRLSMADRLDQMALSDEHRGLLSGLLYEIAGAPLEEAGISQVLRWMALCDWDIERWYDTNKFRPEGGTAAVIGAMLADGRVDVRLGTPVTAIATGPDGVQVTTAAGDVVAADRAVVAVPVNVWPAIAFTPALPAVHAEAARIGMGKPHQDKVWAWVRGPRIGRIFAQLPAPEPLNFFWTYHVEDDRQLIIGINANPALDVTDAGQVAATLQRYVPEIDEVLAVRGQNWAADPYTRGGNTGFRPGQLTGQLAALQQPLGPMAFATADIASGWVGYIDGAIESGMRAARDVLDR